MNFSIYRMSLDIHDINTQAMLNIKKNDTGRKIVFTLTDGGRPYKISDDCSVKFRAKKPDGTVLYNQCVIEDNVILYELTQQTSASAGIVECELTLYGSDNQQITSPRFSLRVDDNLYSDSEIESKDEFTELAKSITETNNLNISASKSGKVATITVSKKDGTTQSVTVWDGEQGPQGEKGDPAVTEQSYDAESENAQSGKAVAEAVQGLENDISEGIESIKDAGWENGGYTTAGTAHARNYRVRSADYLTYTRDITVNAKSGFLVFVLLYDSVETTTPSSTSGTFVSSYKVPANQPFKIAVKRETEDTSETADIDLFISQIYLTAAWKEAIEPIKTAMDKAIYNGNADNKNADDCVTGGWYGVKNAENAANLPVPNGYGALYNLPIDTRIVQIYYDASEGQIYIRWRNSAGVFYDWQCKNENPFAEDTTWYCIGDSITYGRYSYLQVPSATAYYSDKELTTQAGTLSSAYDNPEFVTSTVFSITLEEVTYYVSLSDIVGVTATDMNKCYSYLVNSLLRRYTRINHGHGGMGWLHPTTAESITAMQVISENDFSDNGVITIALGINDYNTNETLGTNTDEAGANTVYGQIKGCIEALIEKTSNPIYLITPINCWQKGTLDTHYSKEKANSAAVPYTLNDLRDAIIWCAEYYGLNVINLTDECCINQTNMLYYLPDGVHPSLHAHELLAREFEKKWMFR